MIDPVAFEIGSLTVRWYGILMALGFLIGFLIVRKLAKYRYISKKDVEDYFIYVIIFAIVGARILHVIQNWSFYSSDLLSILYIWKGGLAFHGGFIAVVIVTLIFCKKRKIHFYDLTDVSVIPLALGLAIGRIGNFINQEMYGRLTDLPWGVEYDVVEGKRHPVQLYESLKNLFIFIVLFVIFKIKTLRRGVIFWSFVGMYSVLRFFAEFIRDQSSWLWGLTMAQWFSIILGILAGIMLIRLTKHL